MKAGWVSFGAVVAVLTGGAALAEPLPLPAADYSIKGTMAGGIAIHYRHGGGKMRMEMQAKEMPLPMVGYFDVKTRKGVMIMNMPGMPPLAMETGLDDEGSPSVPQGSGRRIGSDRVAGEACDEWQMDPQRPEDKAMETVACITRDGIVMRMVGNIEGKRQAILLITEISRAPQDPKQLVPPPGLKPMRMPPGMTPPRK